MRPSTYHTPAPDDVEYKGCIIDSKHRIFSKTTGRQIFTAHWQIPHNLESAKLTIDTSRMADEICKGKRMLAAPAVVHSLDMDEIENAEREKEAQRLDEWADRQNDEHFK